VVIRAGVIFAEVGVDKSVVRGLVIDPEEEELPWLEVGLKFEGNDFESSGASGERLRFGCNCLGKRVHLALLITHMAFIDRWCWRWYCRTNFRAKTCDAGSQVLSLSGYPSHLTRYWSFFDRPVFQCPMIRSTWYSSSPLISSGEGWEKFGPWVVVS
jgi:hypothetical protein